MSGYIVEDSFLEKLKSASKIEVTAGEHFFVVELNKSSKKFVELCAKNRAATSQ